MRAVDIIDMMSQEQKRNLRLLAQLKSSKQQIIAWMRLTDVERTLAQYLYQTLKNDLRAAISKNPGGTTWEDSSWTVEDVKALLGDWPGMPYISDHELRDAMVTVLCS